MKSVHRGLRAWTGVVPLVRGADGVLELPVGTIDATGTAVGDRMEIASAASRVGRPGARARAPRSGASPRPRDPFFA